MKTSFETCLVVMCALSMIYAARGDRDHLQSSSSSSFVELKERLMEVNAEAKTPEFKGVTFNRRLLVNGTLKSKALETANLTVVGDVTASTVKCSRVSSTLISTDVLETGIIRSPTNVITIDGNLVIAGGASSASQTSFLATEVIVGGVRQWSMLHHDDFDHGMDGWNAPGRGSCKESADYFLGGHCKTSSANATKTFKNLPKHSQIRITARVHFLDQWNGEVAYLRSDDRVVWADTAKSLNLPGDAGNVCGGPFADSRISVPVDVTFRHVKSEVELTFGSSLQGNPCEKSWAVDDVVVYVK
eukprot:g4995.t1